MSLRSLTTQVVDCDGPRGKHDACDEVFADVVPMSEGAVLTAARRWGWAEYEIDAHTYHACPYCVIDHPTAFSPDQLQAAHSAVQRGWKPETLAPKED